ncbi:Uncharacterised protein r2_g504 [Pycnogonum litorale]
MAASNSERKMLSDKHSSVYKYCFVLGCTNSSIKTPGKVFLTVPLDRKRREQWNTDARRKHHVDDNGGRYCCEDHFD